MLLSSFDWRSCWTQPDQNIRASFEDAMHETNLLGFLCFIFLVDAQLVDPKRQWIILLSNLSKCCLEARSHRNLVAIYIDGGTVAVMAPSIRQAVIDPCPDRREIPWSACIRHRQSKTQLYGEYPDMISVAREMAIL